VTPELEERLSEYQAAKHEIVELVAGLDDAQFNRRPEANRWSVAECVDHLVVVGRRMVPRIDTAIIRGRGQGWTADGPFRYGFFERWFANAMGEVPPRRRFKAPRIYRPPQRPDWKIPQAMDEFAALQDKFAQLLQHADGLDLARIKVSSPASRFLRFSLGQWLAGLSGHQRRHLWQAQRVKDELLVYQK